MEFEEAHGLFIDQHMKSRTGERRGRLVRGNNFAEKLFLQNVWWPMFESLDDLHPEYEVYDWNRKSQFLDFAFLPQTGSSFGIECDGYQSHVKDMDREKFNYSVNRDTFLTGMGWRMIHFSFDDIQQRPEVCRMLLQLVLAPYLARNFASVAILSEEKEVLRFAWRLGRPVRPKDVATHFCINFRTARRLLQSLSEKGLLKPVNQGERIRYYEVKALRPDQMW
ncbi:MULTISPECIES: hypothetical protein [Paenibacillus]|uniref:hypothetical protein n=1 Tax=Paenibacillus TaxID=44249 RepID=UPI0004F6D704|nr:hypothetical protein [Paenibacillus odorifer]AIQ73929.1 hypothetical protein PODO_12130 [Paenibacillus odorifer]OMD08779.1 hypothetical protein BJP47_07580 [Paenibacillus odorifer]OMD10689.1 hypothetical protein BJP50_27880 [Paenibacillus odorifer]OMD22623.1 hypothetical protein BJP48_28600 [Paenibacillus odorifer]OME32438.1 hypothetical protein BSK63_12530 [Paenibacillus odorifer]